MIWVVAAFWIGCSALSYGMWVYHFQTKFELFAEEDYWVDRIRGVIFSLMGPGALLVALVSSDKIGWKL